MQNKGAIKIFAILLALACIFYLSFTWVTRGVESDAGGSDGKGIFITRFIFKRK